MSLQIPFEITVQELKQWRDEKRDFTLVDVREPSEYQICNIGGKLIPLNSLPQHLAELDPEAEIVVHCKLGGRSGQAVEFMRRNGFPNTRNLRGGIIAWSKEIDPSVVQY